jgi:hypothetical protein
LKGFHCFWNSAAIVAALYFSHIASCTRAFATHDTSGMSNTVPTASAIFQGSVAQGVNRDERIEPDN